LLIYLFFIHIYKTLLYVAYCTTVRWAVSDSRAVQ